MMSSSRIEDDVDVFNRNLSRILDTNRRILDFNITAARYSFSLINNRAIQTSLRAERPQRPERVRTPERAERPERPERPERYQRQRSNFFSVRTRRTPVPRRPDTAQSSERREAQRHEGENGEVQHHEAENEEAENEEAENGEAENGENPQNIRIRVRETGRMEEVPNTRRRLDVDIPGPALNDGISGLNHMEMFFNFARMLNQRENAVNESVENGMTPAQIREATTSGPYSELGLHNEENEDGGRRPRCPIAWTVFEENTMVLKINACGHVFSDTALTEWLRLHSTCPTCRHNLLASNEQFRQRGEGSSEPEPVGLAVPENVPVGIDVNSDLAALGFFANMLRGAPINRSDLENLAGLGDTLNINITNSNIE